MTLKTSVSLIHGKRIRPHVEEGAEPDNLVLATICLVLVASTGHEVPVCARHRQQTEPLPQPALKWVRRSACAETQHVRAYNRELCTKLVYEVEALSAAALIRAASGWV